MANIYLSCTVFAIIMFFFPLFINGWRLSLCW